MSGSSIERLGVFFMALGQSREPGRAVPLPAIGHMGCFSSFHNGGQEGHDRDVERHILHSTAIDVVTL